MKDRLIRETNGDFNIISVLGKGAFGTVMKCLNLHTHKYVALKIIKKYKLTEKQILHSVQESELLRRLDHPRIVKFINIHHTNSFLLLEMELLKGKPLAEVIHEKVLQEEEIANIMNMIFEAVSYLHKVRVLHRDLKPENIMFEDIEFTNLKIIDFGLSTKYNLEERLDARIGTIAYMAPEQIILKKYSEPVDIWSCGIILYKLITGNHPLNFNKDQLEDYIKSLENIEWKFPVNFPELAKDLFLRCTKINPLERYTANLALRHPWITRKPTKIPLTSCEEFRLYQDKFKLKKILISVFLLSGCIQDCKVQGRYLNKIKDPYSETKDDPDQEKIVRAKVDSLDKDFNIAQKGFIKKKNSSVRYGNFLEVPGIPSVSAGHSVRANPHKRSLSKNIPISSSPRPKLSKTAGRGSRQ
jgi:serine/threonine protein kinase